MFKNAVAVLPEADQQLAQLGRMELILKAGIGIHHGGLLPVMKELIELLFQVTMGFECV